MTLQNQSSFSVVLAEDDPGLREAITDTLLLAGFNVIAVANGSEALTVLRSQSDIRMLISDVNMPLLGGYELLKAVQSEFPQIPVLLITAYGTIDQSVKAIQNGAVDYLVKPFDPGVLVDSVKKYACGTSISSESAPVAVDEASKQLLKLAVKIAKTDSTALILGESGTGKEVLARFIHESSSRKDKPFVAINCAAIPETMLESILFGHEKGAFTGANSASAGKFEQANGGTLLLDEISEMDIGLQAKLLRVLQEREVERLGGRKTINLDVRVIATSNREMLREVQRGRFREDLYYRLSVLPLQWQPLRERRADIVPLAEVLLINHAKKQHRGRVNLSQSAKTALFNYPWPGNVRELDNVIQRALILQDGNLIQECDLALTMMTGASITQGMNNCESEQRQPLNDTHVKTDSLYDSETAIAKVPINREEERVEYSGFSTNGDEIHAFTPINHAESEGIYSAADSKSSLFGDKHSVEQASTSAVEMGRGQLNNDLKHREFEVIVNSIRSENGSRKRAAQRLGISPRTLRYKIARFREVGLLVEDCI